MCCNLIGSSKKKNVTMLDSDDAASVSSSSSTMRSENMVFSNVEELQVDKDSLLDQYLDALFEKRYCLKCSVRCHLISC